MVKIFLLLIFFGLTTQASVSNWYSSLPGKSRFTASEDLENRVKFWVRIYSHYSTTQGVFHLVDDPYRFNGEIDLTSIYENDDLTENQKRIQIQNKVQRLRSHYVKKWGVNIGRVRLQMGLKDRMKTALFLSGRYLDQMEDIFKKEKLPVELTRLVFVESSFNIYAQSKVGASGLWQIMPSTVRNKNFIHRNYDKRNHPYYATQMAAKILKANYAELKSWPLAITAYNHGLSGVKRMVKKNGSRDIEDLIDSERPTASWGFASKNFYACFLAVLKVEKNAVNLFGEDLVRAASIDYREYKLPNRVSKNEALKWFDGSMIRFKQMNPHLNWAAFRYRSTLPAGVPLMIPAKNFAMVR